MKEHLRKFHVGAAEHHSGLAAKHAAISSAALEAGDGLPRGPMKDFCRALATGHEHLANRHLDFEEFHKGLAQRLGGLSDSDKVPDVDTIEDLGDGGHEGDELKAYASRFNKVPVGPKVHVILPDRPHHVLVPRPGGPERELEDVTEKLDKLARG